MYTKRVIHAIRDAGTAIIVVTSLLSGGICIGWTYFAVPQVRYMIKEEQTPIINTLTKLNETLDFQAWLDVRTRSGGQYDSLRKEYERFKRR